MYSKDFRRLAIRLWKQHKSLARVSKLLGCGRSSLHRWVNGGIEQRKRRCRHDTWKHLAGGLVKALYDKHPNLSLQAVELVLRKAFGRSVTARTVGSVVRSIGYTLKKVKTRAHRTNLSIEREVAFLARALPDVFESTAPEVVSVDECNFSERVGPMRGFSRRGCPCIVYKPGHWKQKTLLLGVSNLGRKYYTIMDGSCNRDLFEDFIGRLPCQRGTVILLDNVSFHHNCRIYDDKGFVAVHTPPYCPEYNPVEMIFSKVKGAFRSSHDLTGHSICDRIVLATESATPQDVMNCFDHVRRAVHHAKAAKGL